MLSISWSTRPVLLTLKHLWDSAAPSVDLELRIVVQIPLLLSISLPIQILFDQAVASLTSMLRYLSVFLLSVLLLLPWLRFLSHSWPYISISASLLPILFGLVP